MNQRWHKHIEKTPSESHNKAVLNMAEKALLKNQPQKSKPKWGFLFNPYFATGTCVIVLASLLAFNLTSNNDSSAIEIADDEFEILSDQELFDDLQALDEILYTEI